MIGKILNTLSIPSQAHLKKFLCFCLKEVNNALKHPKLLSTAIRMTLVYLFSLFNVRWSNKIEPCDDAIDLAQFCMFDMFTACTTPTVKESIIYHFINSNSKLRIVVATIAFGMGMDCPNVIGSFIGVPLEILKNMFKKLVELVEMVYKLNLYCTMFT